MMQILTVDAKSMAKPGSLGLVLNTTSVQTLLGKGLPMLTDSMLIGKTFAINYTDNSSYFYKLELDSVSINNLTASSPIFEQPAGTDILHVELKDVDIDLEIVGGITFLHFIPLDVKSVHLSGVLLDLDLQTSSEDDVHWMLQDKATLSFKDISIQMDNTIVNQIVSWLNSVIKYFI